MYLLRTALPALLQLLNLLNGARYAEETFLIDSCNVVSSNRSD